MTETAEIVSVFAAVISAIGGAFAALAAFRSADSARVTQRAASDAEHRASVRQISVTATEVLVEVQRIESRAADLRTSYQTLFSFANRSGEGLDNLISEVNNKRNEVLELSDHAKLFITNTEGLKNAPPEEIDRVQMRLSTNLTTVRAWREELDRKHASAEAQNAVYRENVIRGRGPSNTHNPNT